MLKWPTGVLENTRTSSRYVMANAFPLPLNTVDITWVKTLGAFENSKGITRMWQTKVPEWSESVSQPCHLHIVHSLFQYYSLVDWGPIASQFDRQMITCINLNPKIDMPLNKETKPILILTVSICPNYLSELANKSGLAFSSRIILFWYLSLVNISFSYTSVPLYLLILLPADSTR